MAPRVLKADFRHIDVDRAIYFRGVDAGAIMLAWQRTMESFVQEGFTTLTCVCTWIAV
jgi:hypothetical protein